MRIRERMTFANIISVLALIIAVAGTGGGVAYAHGKIGPKDIKKDAVKSKHIKNGKVKSKDLKNNNVKSKDIKDGHVTGADLAGNIDGMVQAAAVVSADGTVTEWFNRGGGAVTVTRMANGVYEVAIPGAPANLGDRIIGAQGYESTSCDVFSALTDTTQTTIICHDSFSTSDQTDSQFSVWLMN